MGTVAERSPAPERLPRLRLAVAARNFGEVPILQAIENAARIGFDCIDNFDWRDPRTFDTYLEGLRRFGLGAGVLVVNKKPDVDAPGCGLVLPEEREGFLRELDLCIDACLQAGCGRLEVLSGNTAPGIPAAKQTESCVETLRAAVPRLERHGMTIVVEMLNSIEDHPGYFLDSLDLAAEILNAVASPRVRLLFDIYHVQIRHGNVIKHIRQYADLIGQIHFADVPGRREPGTGELNFANIFRAIYDLDYQGYVTAEYHPTDFTFRDLELTKKLATFGERSNQ